MGNTAAFAAAVLLTSGSLFAAEPAKTKPSSYTIPWQLRPIVVPNAIRWDNSFAFYETNKERGFTYATVMNAIIRIPGTGVPQAGLGAVIRIPFVMDDPPANKPTGAALANPQLGATYGIRLGESYRLNFFVGFTIPIGMGGGDTPDPNAKNARVKAAPARAQHDGAPFAVNDFTVNPGMSFGYVDHGLTLQMEATLFQMMRVRGCSPEACDQKEEAKTNFTTGIHAGYYVHPNVSFGVDLRYQHWINAPFAVEADKTMDSYDNLSIALGLRFHIPLEKHWLRPGIAYSRMLDLPFTGGTISLDIMQVDIVFVF